MPSNKSTSKSDWLRQMREADYDNKQAPKGKTPKVVFNGEGTGNYTSDPNPPITAKRRGRPPKQPK